MAAVLVLMQSESDT